MKIVYLLSVFELVGGQELYLARQQARQGHEVIVVTSDVHYPLKNLRERYAMEGLTEDDYDAARRRLSFDGMTIYRLPSPFHYQDFIYARGVGRLLKHIRPDVVFGHEPRTIVPALGAFYKKRLGFVYLLDVHDLFHKVQSHHWWQRALRYAEYFYWRRFFVDYALAHADRIIAVAGECRRFLERRHGIPDDRITDLPLGVDTDFFQFHPDARVRRRAELGYSDRDVVLMFSGYMFRRKALESLIDLLAEAPELSLKLLLVGEGPEDYLTELKKRAHDKGVAAHVNFFGFVSRREISELYSSADIGVWPGNNTLAILEAMACRLPVVIADMQLAHLARHGNGLTVPYADVKALRDAMTTLARDAALRRRMGEAGERAILQEYSYARLAARVTSWMEMELAKKRRPA